MATIPAAAPTQDIWAREVSDDNDEPAAEESYKHKFTQPHADCFLAVTKGNFIQDQAVPRELDHARDLAAMQTIVDGPEYKKAMEEEFVRYEKEKETAAIPDDDQVALDNLLAEHLDAEHAIHLNFTAHLRPYDGDEFESNPLPAPVFATGSCDALPGAEELKSRKNVGCHPEVGLVQLSTVQDTQHHSKFVVNLKFKYKHQHGGHRGKDGSRYADGRVAMHIYGDNIDNPTPTPTSKEDDDQDKPYTGFRQLNKDYDIWVRKYVQTDEDTLDDYYREVVARELFKIDDEHVKNLYERGRGEFYHVVIVHSLGGPDARTARGEVLYAKLHYDDYWTPRLDAWADATHVEGSTIHLLVPSHEFPTNFDTTITQIETPPNESWWTDRGISYQLGQDQITSDRRPQYVMKRQLVYGSRKELRTVIWHSAVDELNAVENRCSVAVPIVFWALELSDTGGNAYIFFIEPQPALNPTIGDTFRICWPYNEHSAESDNNWTGTYVDSFVRDTHHLCAFVRRGCITYDEVPGEPAEGPVELPRGTAAQVVSWSELQIRHFMSPMQQLEPDKVRQYIANSEYLNTASIKSTESNKAQRRVVAALSQLGDCAAVDKKGNEKSIAEQCYDLFQGANLLRPSCTPMDLFGCLIQDRKDDMTPKLEGIIEKLKRTQTLTGEQKVAFQVCRALRAGVLCLQGLAGTGKSYLAIVLLRVFMEMVDTDNARRTALVLSSSNANAEATLEKLKAIAAEVSKETGYELFVARAYSKQTHVALMKKGFHASSSVFEDGEVVDIPALAQSITATLRAHLSGRSGPVDGVNNRWLLHEEDAIGTLAMHALDWHHPNFPEFSTNHRFRHPNAETRYAAHRSMLDMLANGTELTQEQANELGDLIRDLLFDTLRRIHVLVSTPNQAIDPALYRAIGQQTAVVVIEEATRIADMEMLTLMYLYRINNNNKPCFVLVGDGLQLGFRSSALLQQAPQNTPFAYQSQFTTFMRFSAMGVTVVRLFITNRANDFVNDAIGSIGAVYKCIVPDANNNRPLALAACTALGTAQPGIWLETIGSHSRSATGSKSNPENVKACLDMVLHLCARAPAGSRINPDQIVVISPYKSQVALYIESFRALVNWIENDLVGKPEAIRAAGIPDNVDLKQLARGLQDEILMKGYICTVDSVMGQDRGCVFYDITTSSEIGFLKDTSRNYVAVSRAKDVLITIGNAKGLKEHVMEKFPNRYPSLYNLTVFYYNQGLLRPSSHATSPICAVVDGVIEWGQGFQANVPDAVEENVPAAIEENENGASEHGVGVDTGAGAHWNGVDTGAGAHWNGVDTGAGTVDEDDEQVYHSGASAMDDGAIGPAQVASSDVNGEVTGTW